MVNLPVVENSVINISPALWLLDARKATPNEQVKLLFAMQIEASYADQLREVI